MRTIAARALLAATLLPVVACAVAPGGTLESTGSSSAALTGGVPDTTHLAVATAPGCVGTFIAPGLVLTSPRCFEGVNSPVTAFTSYDAAGNATLHRVDPSEVTFLRQTSYGQPCGVTGYELAVAGVAPTLSPSVVLPPLASDTTSPGAGASVDLVAFGAGPGGGSIRRTATASVTQVAPPLLDLAPGSGALDATDTGAPVFFGGAVAGVFDCPAGEQASDVASSASWIEAQSARYAAPSCLAPEASCEPSGTVSVPTVTVSCATERTGQDLYRQAADGSWTRVQSLYPWNAATFTDTPGVGTKQYLVCSPSACVPLTVDVPRCGTIKHCPTGSSLCDGECVRGPCL